MHFKHFFESSQIWTSDSNNRIKWVEKMIFMLFHLVWDRTHQMKRNFEHLVLETRPWTSVRMILEFQENQMKYENYEICQYLMISYMETSKTLNGFCNFFTYDAYEWKHLRKRIRELRSMRLGLEWKWRSNLDLTSKFFYSQ